MLLTTHLLLGMLCVRPRVCSTPTYVFKPVCMTTLFEITGLLLGLPKCSAQSDDVCSTPIHVFEPVYLNRLLKTICLLLGLCGRPGLMMM